MESKFSFCCILMFCPILSVFCNQKCSYCELNVAAPKKNAKICCLASDSLFFASFKIQAGFVFRLKLARKKPSIGANVIFDVSGNWDGQYRSGNFSEVITDVWAASGEFNISSSSSFFQHKFPTTDTSVIIHYSSYECEGYYEECAGCFRDDVSHVLLSQAPPGLTCMWQFRAQEQNTWIVGLKGFTSQRYSSSDSSLSLFDVQSSCILSSLGANFSNESETLLISNANEILVYFDSGKCDKDCKERCGRNFWRSICRNDKNNKLDFKQDNLYKPLSYNASFNLMTESLKCDQCIGFNNSPRLCTNETVFHAIHQKAMFNRSASNFSLTLPYYNDCNCLFGSQNGDKCSLKRTTNFANGTPTETSPEIHSTTGLFTTNLSTTSSALPTFITTELEILNSTIFTETFPMTTTSMFTSTIPKTLSTAITTTPVNTTYFDTSTTSTTSMTTSSLTSTIVSTTSTPSTSLPPATSIASTSTSTSISSSEYVSTIGSTIAPTTLAMDDYLSELANMNVTLTNVGYVLESLTDIMDSSSTNLTSDEVADVGQILMNTANLNGLETQYCTQWMDILNVLLANSPPSSIQQAQTENNTCNYLLQSVDLLASNALINESMNYTFFYNGSEVALSVTVNNCTLGVYANVVCQADDNTVSSFSADSPPPTDYLKSYLFLPPSVVCSNASRSIFKIYNSLKLFANQSILTFHQNWLEWFLSYVIKGKPQATTKWCQQQVSAESHVISGTVTVMDKFQQSQMKMKMHSKKFSRQQISCGYWNYNTSSWDQEGCNYMGISEGMASFTVDHLTDFALLVTIQPTDPSICDQVLNDLGFGASIVSTISLAFVIATLIVLMFKPTKLRSGKSYSKFLFAIGFNGTLFIFFLVFTVASDQSRVPMTLNACNINAAIMYTLLNSVMLWVLAKSIQFYKMYVIVFQTGNSWCEKVFSDVSLVVVCFVVPIIVTVILWYTEEESFKRNDQFCWITPQLTLYGVVIPMSVLLFINIIVTICVAKSLFGLSLTRDRSTLVFKPKNQKKVFWRKMRVILGMQIVLGMPWIMQYCTFGSINLNVFNYLFTILNGFQGLWIAMLYFYDQKNKIQKHLELSRTKTFESVMPLNLRQRLTSSSSVSRTNILSSIDKEK